MALPRGVPWPAAGWDWLGVAYIGIGTSSVAYFLFAWGARRLTPTASAIAIMIEPLVTTLLATWLLAESLAPRQWAGAALLGAAMLPLARRAAPPRGARCRMTEGPGRGEKPEVHAEVLLGHFGHPALPRHVVGEGHEQSTLPGVPR